MIDEQSDMTINEREQAGEPHDDLQLQKTIGLEIETFENSISGIDSAPVLRPFEPMEVIACAFSFYFDSLGILTASTLVILLFHAASISILLVPQIFVESVTLETSQIIMSVKAVIEIGLIPVVVLLLSYFWSGYTVLMLKIVRGQPPRMRDIFSGGNHMIQMAIGSFVFGGMVASGTILMIYPGLLIGIIFFPWSHLLVDENLGWAASFSRARQLTAGNWVSIFALILFEVFCLFSSLVCAIFPIVLSVPFVTLLNALAYVQMTRQPDIDTF